MARNALWAVKAKALTATGTVDAAAKYSDQVGQPQSKTVVKVEGSSSTKHSRSAISAWTSARVGAIPKPQLPMTMVVIPWVGNGSSDGSQNISRS